MQVRWLGVIRGGVSDGIQVIDSPKHRGFNPSRYHDPWELQRDTDPLDRGSKWLPTVSDQERFELIRQVLEAHRARLNGPRGVYRSEPQPRPVGVSRGRPVHSVEVRFDGRQAHGYPCDP